MKKILFALLLLLPFAFSSQGLAKAPAEHPLIRPYPGSVLIKNKCQHKKFDQFQFRVPGKKKTKAGKKTVKGEYWKLYYQALDSNGKMRKDISAVEFLENYKAAALEKGGKIIWEDRRNVVFTLPRSDGGITWCQARANPRQGQQYLDIINEKPFKKSLTFGPAQMKAALDKDGRISLYGITFDFDKATLKKESLKELANVLTLLQANPDLTLEIQGHTDNKGSDKYNLELSQARAETVRKFLLLFNVADKRLTAKGYGETKPVASNNSEDGRAKNRRVELVKR